MAHNCDICQEGPDSGYTRHSSGSVAHNCDDICRDLHCYLDGEATVASRSVIAVHLEGCPSCADAFRFEAQIRLVVARCCCEDPVPESLRVRVLQAIYTADP